MPGSFLGFFFFANHQGINIDNSQAAYVDYITKNGNMEAAALAMAGDIQAAIATGQLSAVEVAQLQGVLAGLMGDAELAAAYVSSAMDEKVESGYNDKRGVADGAVDIDGIIRDGSHLKNGVLKPNVTYQSGEHAYIYTTNEDGLITNARTDSLQLKTHSGRLNHNPNTYGKVEGDQAGHLFGDRFGGSPELDNLVSQAQRVNQSEFKIIENQWANALRNGQQVTVDITINYEGGTRPVSFDMYYTIDGVPFFSSISN